MNKYLSRTIVYSALIVAALVGLFVLFTPSMANAQFRPCVWPNTCRAIV